MTTKKPITLDIDFWDDEIASASIVQHIFHSGREIDVISIESEYEHSVQWSEIWLTKDDILELAKAAGITKKDFNK